MNQPVPVDGGNFQYAAWGVVLLALVHLCWLQLRPESELRRFWAETTESNARRAAMMEQDPSGRIAGQAAAGNVLLELAGYAKTNPVVEGSLCFIYYRTTYVLYPRRIYAAPADQVINNGRDIMRIGFCPNQQWLQEHDVRSVLTFGDNNNGKTLRLEILPPRDGQAVMQTNKSGGN